MSSNEHFDQFLISTLEFQRLFALESFDFVSGDISIKNYFKKSNVDHKQGIVINETHTTGSKVDGDRFLEKNVNFAMQFQSIEGDSVEKIFDEIRNFNECILKKSANNTVCGDGNMINPDVVLIGEAPGEEEDLAGVPFCGKSGKLLEKALSLIGLNRKLNLFITNSVFWRPPNNRKPTTNEINLCKPFVLRMISVLQPKLVILCGSTAHSVIFNNDDKMSDLVGKMIDLNNIKFTTVYHPSYLIRNPIAKKNMWDNLLVIKNYLSH